MRIKLDEGAYEPTRAHGTDAGIDIRARHGAVILPHSGTVIETGVHVELPKGCAGVLISKSGLNVNSDLTSTGLIDEGFTGAIIVKLYNHGDTARYINAGDKISQLVVVPVFYEPIEIVDEINQDTDRGTDGFGSTGR